MSINGALQIGRSALTTSQAGLQTAGNNMANAATVGYTRRSVHLAPSRDEMVANGAFLGTGVELSAIRREVDTALQSRLRDAIAEEHGAVIDQRFLTQIETLQNELTDNDLSTLLSEFFNSFSEAANNPQDSAIRSLVVQQGDAVASRIAELRQGYISMRQQVDRSLGQSVTAANDLLDSIASLNTQIATTEHDGTVAAGLRDKRDVLLNELSGYVDISTVEQENGATDVFIGSTPVVLDGTNRGLELRTTTVDGEPNVTLRIKADGTLLEAQSGELGALMRQRGETIDPAIETLDTFAASLIHEVNTLHSQGQGLLGQESIAGFTVVEDATVNLNNDAADIPFDIGNGSFFIHVTNQQTGLRTSHRIDVNGDAMSLDDLVDEVNTVVGVPNVTAGVNAERQFTLDAAAGYEMSFSDDTSGALAALGVNTFFTGRGAGSIGVAQTVKDDPRLLALGAGHVEGSNDTAIAMANLQDAGVDSLGGKSLRSYWQEAVGATAVKLSAANSAAEATKLVRESISAQSQAVSGVSLDEEAINMMMFQRQFQAAARFISVIDETIQTLLAMA